MVYYKIQNDLFRKDSGTSTTCYEILKNPMFSPVTLGISVALSGDNTSLLTIGVILDYFRVKKTKSNIQNAKYVLDYYVNSKLGYLVEGSYESVNDYFMIELFFYNGYFTIYENEIKLIRDGVSGSDSVYSPIVLYLLIKSNMYHIGDDNYDSTNKLHYGFFKDRTGIGSYSTLTKYVHKCKEYNLLEIESETTREIGISEKTGKETSIFKTNNRYWLKHIYEAEQENKKENLE